MKPTTKPEEFERYIGEMPRIDVPGARIYFTKRERGERAGEYAYFVEFDSVERRNELFPVENNPGAGKEGRRLMETWLPFLEKSTLLIVGQPFEIPYTDHVVIGK